MTPQPVLDAKEKEQIARAAARDYISRFYNVEGDDLIDFVMRWYSQGRQDAIDQIQQSRGASEAELRIATEFGFKCAEKGWNLEQTFAEFNAVTKG